MARLQLSYGVDMTGLVSRTIWS